MTTSRAKIDAQITAFHAESRAHSEANVTRLSRMLGLIAIGFGGLAAVASLLWKDNRTEVLFVAPFVILILWMSCIRILAEMTISGEYQRYYDRRLAELLDSPVQGFRSWQDSAPQRGGRSAANLTIYGFVAIVSLAVVSWCAWEAATTAGWLGWILVGVWTAGTLAIVISAFRLPHLRRAVAADLDAEPQRTGQSTR